ncbi:MAG: hypothetical protein ABIL58_19960 [Pseudomonadota bacterium]
MTQKTYEIDGRAFEHRPLVLGQLRQLIEVISGMAMPDDMNPLGIVHALGERLPRALAVVLVDTGCHDLAGRDIDELSAFMDNHMEIDAAVEVAEDFLQLNRVSSLAARLGKLVGLAMPTPSPSSAPSAAAETSQKETGPCGT